MNKVILCENALYFVSIKKCYYCKHEWDVEDAISDFLNDAPYELVHDDSFQLSENEHGPISEWQFF
ncbi:hypothetical protein [Vibrio cholerae]|uniref:hypothetical protein n=1 Tax=Vibrio cholerae TaxID=666 RepID=UPI0004E31A78|nr:hypothetical protein [Vibrio cholerae]EGR2417041.1 hypothetical protein [Vibrio cholerae]EGR2474693.1 hypothetical protein [Vibrio cholerae]EJL6303950.1 hypothetical protein [Vibrio cholerae]EJL6542828.1 hypothetical protein [Vibrio cholerae]KFD84170.1 hypothetical protein DN41_2034 [Vibrio cholerae]